MKETSFLGTGIRFPVSADKGTGRFALSSEEENVRESVYLILMTQQGERHMDPQFGSRLFSYTFMDISVSRLHIMKNEIRGAILEQEPRIDDVVVEIEDRGREGCLLIHVTYRISRTNTRDNLVFPFYLNAVTGEELHGNEAATI